MEPVKIPLPEGASIAINALYPTDDPRFLTDDLLVVKLPNGNYIDVGWFPEFDPNGCFEICVFDTAYQHVLFPTTESKWREVIERVSELADVFGQPTVRKDSQTSTQRIEAPLLLLPGQKSEGYVYTSAADNRSVTC